MPSTSNAIDTLAEARDLVTVLDYLHSAGADAQVGRKRTDGELDHGAHLTLVQLIADRLEVVHGALIERPKDEN